MIVLLNGAFGVGKTTVAAELVRRLAGAIVFDPEHMGALIRTALRTVDPVEDFQNYAVWRSLIVDGVRRLREQYSGPLIVPISLWRAEYFTEIASGLRAADSDTVCIMLTATRNVLMERIRNRPETEGSHQWCLDHLEACLVAAQQPSFGTPVRTDDRSPAEITEAILGLLPSE